MGHASKRWKRRHRYDQPPKEALAASATIHTLYPRWQADRLQGPVPACWRKVPWPRIEAVHADKADWWRYPSRDLVDQRLGREYSD